MERLDSATHYAPIRILLVDDDEDDFLITKDLLDRIGPGRYEVTWTNSFAEARDAIFLDNHDVYIFDYYLGEHNGLELLREAGNLACHAPSIILTGRSDAHIDHDAMTAGAFGYLVKAQFDAPTLDRVIRYAIERKRAEDNLRVRNHELKSEIERRSMRSEDEQAFEFYRDILCAVTGDRLLLCSEPELKSIDLGSPVLASTLISPTQVGELRHTLARIVRESALDYVHIENLETAVTEAAANALKHAECGEARVWVGVDFLAVAISDLGPGIPVTKLARALLESGFSTVDTLGLGFTMIMAMSDSVVLSTGEHGTTVMIIAGNRPDSLLNLVHPNHP